MPGGISNIARHRLFNSSKRTETHRAAAVEHCELDRSEAHIAAEFPFSGAVSFCPYSVQSGNCGEFKPLQPRPKHSDLKKQEGRLNYRDGGRYWVLVFCVAERRNLCYSFGGIGPTVAAGNFYARYREHGLSGQAYSLVFRRPQQAKRGNKRKNRILRRASGHNFI